MKSQYYALNPYQMSELNELSSSQLGSVKLMASQDHSPVSSSSKLLVVGIGGMGGSSVAHLKKKLMRQ